MPEEVSHQHSRQNERALRHAKVLLLLTFPEASPPRQHILALFFPPHLALFLKKEGDNVMQYRSPLPTQVQVGRCSQPLVQLGATGQSKFETIVD